MKTVGYNGRMPFVWLLVRLLIYGLAMLTGIGATNAAAKLSQHRREKKLAAEQRAREKKIAERFKSR
jgi:hypothetical protein